MLGGDGGQGKGRAWVQGKGRNGRVVRAIVLTNLIHIAINFHQAILAKSTVTL